MGYEVRKCEKVFKKVVVNSGDTKTLYYTILNRLNRTKKGRIELSSGTYTFSVRPSGQFCLRKPKKIVYDIK